MVNDIYNSSKIPFQLIISNMEEYYSPEFDKLQSCILKEFKYENIRCCIRVNTAFSVAIDLLELCIKDKLNEVFLHKKNIISLLLSGNDVDKDLVKIMLPAIKGEFNLVNIYVENYIDEVFTYIKESIIDSNVEILIYNNNVLIVGQFEDVLEHVKSIEETINSNLSGKCYISYCTVKDYHDFKRAYENTLYKLQIAIKYNIEESIFDEKDLILEGIIDSVSDEMKSNMFKSFNFDLSQFDNELIKTVDVFFKCGLNLSEAAKELYIHRNTLIYRLDKIQKYTSYDIREFQNAMLFKILIFYLTKEKNNSFNLICF